LFCLEKHSLPLQQWMTMKKPPQRLVFLQPWLRPPKTSTWLELLSMTTRLEPPPWWGLNRGGGQGARCQAALFVPMESQQWSGCSSSRNTFRANGASSCSERSMASSHGSSRGQQHSEYQDGFSVPDAAFTPSHHAMVQVQTALREEARMAEPNRVVMGSWTGTPFTNLYTSRPHEAVAQHLSEVGRGLQAHNLLGLANSTWQSAGLYVRQTMSVGAVRDRWYRIFDNCNAHPFQDGYGLLLALDKWLSTYINPHVAEAMVT